MYLFSHLLTYVKLTRAFLFMKKRQYYPFPLISSSLFHLFYCNYSCPCGTLISSYPSFIMKFFNSVVFSLSFLLPLTHIPFLRLLHSIITVYFFTSSPEYLFFFHFHNLFNLLLLYWFKPYLISFSCPLYFYFFSVNPSLALLLDLPP